MGTKDTIVKEGTVKESHQAAMFKIELDEGEEVIGTLSGKLRKFRIKILPGDRVRIEFSPYDKTRGRITYRLKEEGRNSASRGP